MDKYNEHELLELEDGTSNAFQINSLDDLNWAFRKLSALNKKKIEINELANKEYDRVLRWVTVEEEKIKRSEEYFQHITEEFHRREMERDPKQKTISTPYGKLKSRVSKPSPKVVDKEKLLDHVLENQMEEFIKKEVKWGDFKKTVRFNNGFIFDENGMIVQGLEMTKETTTYSIEVE